MRKLVVMAVFAFTVVATQFLAVPNAAAEDVYLGTSDTTGRQCFLVRDSIDPDRQNMTFTCTIKMVKPHTDDVQFLSYEFWFVRNDGWYFESSQGYSNKVSEHTPIEDRILRIAEYVI